MKIMVVAGARPNFMKVAPLIEALRAVQARCPALEYTLVHTGQHYDAQMSQAFFEISACRALMWTWEWGQAVMRSKPARS